MFNTYLYFVLSLVRLKANIYCAPYNVESRNEVVDLKFQKLRSRDVLCVCLPQVRSDRDKFTVYLDVKHFSPDELSVKVADDYVEIQGKHGERQVVLLSDAHTTSE